MQVVLLGDFGQLTGHGVHHIDPGEWRLGTGEHDLDGHASQIRLAATAAPKPLSMFTTVTPEAQEFSIPSKAASPPKEAPYPTLVGTAMTGVPTKPPTTLGRAPSIPATTITTLACRS